MDAVSDRYVDFGPAGVLERLGRHWRVIVVLALVGLVLAGGRLLMSGVPHTAESQVLIGQPVTVQSLTSPTGGGVDQARLVDLTKRVIDSRALAEQVEADLGIDRGDYSLAVISASATNVIGIRVAAPDGERAQQVANAFAKGYIASVRAENSGRVKRAEKHIAAEVDAVDAQLALLAGGGTEVAAQRTALLQQRVMLQSKLSQATLAQAVDPAGGARVVESASEGEASAFTVGATLALGALFGALVGVGVAAVRMALPGRSSARRRVTATDPAEPAPATA